MPRPIVAALTLFAVALAAGCGGGGSSSGVVPTGGGSSGSAGSTGASVAIVIPPKPATALGKSPAYVSPNTASIGIVVTPQGGTAYPTVIANVPGSQCTAAGGGYTCTISVTATFGVDTVAITAYSAANAGGSVLSSGSITSTFSASASPSPALNVVLTGAVKQIGLSIVHGSVMDAFVPIGDPATLNVVGKDASGAVIVGTYDAPITVALPGGSGLSLGTASFADSTHTTSTITYLGAPSYYNAPTSAVTITASAGGGAVTQTFALHPVTSLLSFAAGDGRGNAYDIRNMVQSGGNLIYLTSDDDSSGELVSMNPATGAQTILNPALGYVPNTVLVDPKFGGIWISTSQSGTAALHCVSGASDTPVSVATAGPSDPSDMTVDGTDHLWFTDDDYVGNVTLNGLCSVDDSGPQLQFLFDDAGEVYSSGIAADTSNGNVWIGNDNSNADAFFATLAASSLPQPVGLPNGSRVGEMTRDATGDILVSVSGQSNTIARSHLRAAFSSLPDSFIETIPAGQNDFLSTYYTLPLGSNPYAIAVQSSVGGLIAYGSGGVGILSPANPDQSFIVPPVTVGQHPYCDGLAFDGAGQPWGLCSGDDSSALVRLVLTDSWNVFSNIPNPMPVATGGELAIAGGTATQSFTLGCTGGITCAFLSGSPRLIEVDSRTDGPASVTVTDNAGRSVITNLTVNGTQIEVTKKRPTLRNHRLHG